MASISRRLLAGGVAMLALTACGAPVVATTSSGPVLRDERIRTRTWTNWSRLRTTTTTSTTTAPGAVAPAAPSPTPLADQLDTAPDGSAMRITFNDEFDSLDATKTKWNVRDSTYLHTNHVENVFRADNVAVNNGILRLKARKEADGTVTSGMLMTGRQTGGPLTFKMGHGFVEVRAKFPAKAGAWPGIWMSNPGDGTVPSWPTSGEIDIAEFYGDRPAAVETNFHWAEDGVHKHAGAGYHKIADATQWHTYGVGIHPDRLEYFYDGVLVRTISATTPGRMVGMNYEHCIILNLAVGGSGPSYHGYEPGSAPLPYAAEFDYVRAWQP